MKAHKHENRPNAVTDTIRAYCWNNQHHQHQTAPYLVYIADFERLIVINFTLSLSFSLCLRKDNPVVVGMGQ